MNGRIELDHSAVDELAAAYALGALEPAEERAVSEHLAACEEPHREARAALEAATVVGASLEPVAPSAGLRDRLMATVAATPQEHRAPSSRPAPEPASVAEEPRRPWWRMAPLATAVAAVAVVAAVGIGVWGLSLRGELNDRDAALEAVASADAIFAASGAAGTGWVVESGDQAMFMARDLEALPAGSIYELWLIGPEGPTAVGTLSDTEGVALVTLEQPLTGSSTFAVTVESERVDAPTSDPVLVAPLDA
jgi:anti-sigma-K factor RskA